MRNRSRVRGRSPAVPLAGPLRFPRKVCSAWGVGEGLDRTGSVRLLRGEMRAPHSCSGKAVCLGGAPRLLGRPEGLGLGPGISGLMWKAPHPTLWREWGLWEVPAAASPRDSDKDGDQVGAGAQARSLQGAGPPLRLPQQWAISTRGCPAGVGECQAGSSQPRAQQLRPGRATAPRLTSQLPAHTPEARGWVPDLPVSVAKTQQVRRPPSHGVETLPKNASGPDLPLGRGDALGLAGLAGNPGAQRLTGRPVLPGPLRRSTLALPPPAGCPGSGYPEA